MSTITEQGLLALNIREGSSSTVRSMNAIKLYNYWRSSASWRVRTGLYAKGLDFEYIPVHLVQDGGQQNSDDYQDMNAMRQVPLLEYTDGEGQIVRIAQSIAILEHLEELHPTPALLPQDPVLRAKARQLAEIINAGTQPLQNLSVIKYLKDIDVDTKAFCQHWIERGLRGYQNACEQTFGDFSIGDEPTIADICLIPQLYNARRFEVDLEPFALLTEIEEAAQALEFFQRAAPEAQPDAQG